MSLLKAKHSQLSQSFLLGEMLYSLHHLCGFFLESLQYVQVSLVWGSPDLAQHCGCVLTSVE